MKRFVTTVLALLLAVFAFSIAAPVQAQHKMYHHRRTHIKMAARRTGHRIRQSMHRTGHNIRAGYHRMTR